MKSLHRYLAFLFFYVPIVLSFGQDLNQADSLELALHGAKNDKQKVSLLIALAEEFITNNPDKATLYAVHARVLADSIGYSKGQLSARRIQAEISWKSADYKNAIPYATDAMIRAVELGDLQEKAAISLIFGYVFSDLGDYEKSSKYMFEGLRINEELKNKKGISKALNAIGYIYFEQEQYDKSLEYYANALSISRELRDRTGISRGLNNVAAVYGNNKDYANVKRYLFEAIKINQDIGQRSWVGINYMNLGFVNFDEKIYDSCFYYYNKAIRIFEGLNHMLQLSNVLIGVSKYYVAVDSIDQGEATARRAYQIGKAHKLIKATSAAANQLHQIFDKTSSIDSAHYYAILSYQLKDSLQLEQSVTQLSQLELMYEYEKLSQEKRIAEQKKEFTYLILFISLVFLMVVVFLIYTSRQKIRAKNLQLAKTQLESELEIKNKELTFNVMALMKKNEVLAEIANKLMEVQEAAVKEETKSTIRKLAKELQKTSDDEVWEEFEIRFMQVHGEFYRQLIGRFPDLSPNEQKLCAFLRLNMSTKEISELTGQRPGSLEIARARLRKKLGISNTSVNLVTFLSKL